MAALTPQFKIKCNLDRGEFTRVVYANFSKLTYQPNLKTPCAGEMARHFFVSGDCTKWKHFSLVEISSDTEQRESAMKAYTWISFSFQYTLTLLLSVIYFN